MIKIRNFIYKDDTVVLKLGLIGWLILYITYVLTHKIPVNPAGFYLESARQLIQNNYQIPEFVTGFGEHGIPFAYPPIGVYVYALVGKLLGNLPAAGLLIPGLLLPMQAFAGYLFVKQFTGSKQASQWAAVFLLFVPHIVNRTLYGDGIPTGLAGIFLLLSWYFAAKQIEKPVSFRYPVVGGIFVGLSILSHPGIGLFCSVAFTMLFLSCTGINIRSIVRLIVSGMVALLLVTLLWLLPVVSIHGIAPILASVKDTKSSLFILTDMKDSLSYIYDKHFEDMREGFSLFLFPLPIAVIYSLFYGPRISLLLLLAGVFTFKGHPTVTMFVFSLCVGVFYNVLANVISYRHLQAVEQETETQPRFASWYYPAFIAIHIGILFIVGITYALSPAFFSSGEEEIYSWIKDNTSSDSTFVIEDVDENLVYFGQRTILLPVWGAEWIPDSEFGNGSVRSDFIKSRIFNCRSSDCLVGLFLEYNVFPDYLIFRIESDEEQAWVDAMGASEIFELAFSSGDMVSLACKDCRRVATSSSESP